jgi:hypothetical protein
MPICNAACGGSFFGLRDLMPKKLNITAFLISE